MSVIDTHITEVIIIEPAAFLDERAFFIETL